MKRKDVFLIVVVAFIGAVTSFVVSGMFITTSEDRNQQVETADEIVTDFNRPPEEYFNEDSVNPTQTIKIDDDVNKNPFDEE